MGQEASVAIVLEMLESCANRVAGNSTPAPPVRHFPPRSHARACRCPRAWRRSAPRRRMGSEGRGYPAHGARGPEGR
jgi:hypothetical protein